MNKTLISIFTVVLSAIAPTPVYANNDPHVLLVNAVISTGVDLRVNQYEDCSPDMNDGNRYFGWYNGKTKSLVICQEEAHAKNTWGVIYYFSPEDLDTLRHESHHMVQDCMDRIIDSSLDTVYNKPIELALDVIGKEGVDYVVDAYSGESKHTQILEVEAFAVSAINDPLEQVNDIRRFCF